MTETPPPIPGKYAYRLSGDRHQAEDIMATAFLELSRRSLNYGDAARKCGLLMTLFFPGCW